jgi:hypothetical protein
MTKYEALRMALEALEKNTKHLPADFDYHFEAITAIKEALAQPEQPPQRTWEQAGENWVHPDWFEDRSEALKIFADLVRANEREACQALHQHEDVLAPVGNSAWGEAYQEGWAAGAAAYLGAIRARGQA